MGRKPKSHFISPSDPRLQEQKPVVELLPSIVVRGFIRGLLNHIWTQGRRKKNEKRISIDDLESLLMNQMEEEVRGWKKYEIVSLQPQQYLQGRSRSVSSLIKALTRHSPLAIKRDSAWVIDLLKGYKGLRSEGNRKIWLRDHLQPILDSLNHLTRGSCCRGNTDFPDEKALEEWSKIAGIRRLTSEIVGHFHCKSPSRIKRLFSTPL